jgi:hypothetical protein
MGRRMLSGILLTAICVVLPQGIKLMTSRELFEELQDVSNRSRISKISWDVNAVFARVYFCDRKEPVEMLFPAGKEQREKLLNMVRVNGIDMEICERSCDYILSPILSHLKFCSNTQ